MADADDLDQGQHYAREDALAVSLAGALVRRRVWEELGGTDPAYGSFGSGLDLCRRCWRAGHDVVVVPAARVRHAQAGLYGRTSPDQTGTDHRRTYAARRASEWYHALAWSPAWAAPLLLLWVAASAIARAAYRLASTEVTMVSAELRVPFVLASRLHRLPASRTRIALAGTKPVERPLLASWLDVARHIRARELGAYESWRAENRPSEVQVRELRTLAVRRHWTLLGLTGGLVAISFALYGSWLSRLIDGKMLTGGALGATNVTVAELWDRTWTGWSDVGLGAGSLDGGWAALMIPLAIFPGGLAVGIGLMLTLAPLWAGLAAWASSGAATRSVTARALAAIAWSVWPPFLQSVVDGRVGAVIVHTMLPIFAFALVRAVSAQRRDRLGDGTEFPTARVGSPAAGALAGVVMAVITIAAPAMLVPLVLGVVGVVIVARGHRRIALLVLVVPLVAAGPGIVAAWSARAGDWLSVLLREPGPSAPFDPAAPAPLLLGVIKTPPDWPLVGPAGDTALAYLIGAGVIVAALLALGGARHAAAVRTGWFVAAAGISLAVACQRTVVAPVGLDGSQAANGWPAPGLSLVALGLIGAALVGLRADADTSSFSAPMLRATRATNIAAGVAASVIVAVHVAAAAWPGRDFGGDVHPADAEVLPLVAGLESSSSPLSRVLVVRNDGDGVTYTVLTRDGAAPLLGRGFLANDGTLRNFQLPDGAVHGLTPIVAALAGAGDGAATQLRGEGVGAVVVPPGSEEVAAALLRSQGLTVIGSSERGLTWRVSDRAEVAPSDRASRVWLESGGQWEQSLDSTPTTVSASLAAGADDRAVVLATPARAGWTATLNGRLLPSVNHDGMLAFQVGADAGDLRVRFLDTGYRRWWWLTAAALAWTIFNAIPIRDRRFDGRTM